MTRPFRFLGGADSPATAAADSSSEPITADSVFVVILAALLCALICVLGLVSVARCAWLRRSSAAAASSSAQPPPPPPSKANKGLKKKIFRSLPKLTCTPESASQFSDCAICLADFAAGDEIRVLPHCGHAFHVACIDKWLGSHSSCPSCRRILVPTSGGRCEKCGNLPATSTSATVTETSTSTAEAEARLKRREDDVNRFLP